MRLKADLTLLFVAAVWGSGFIAQRLATGQLSTLYFNGGRFLLAALLLFLLARVLPAMPARERQATRKQLPLMALVGVLLFAAAGLQQAGLATTSIGNASFITGLYVVLVPLILFVFFRQRIAWMAWAAVGLAVIGVMLLSLQGSFALAPGDALVLVGAVAWAMHIILIGRLGARGVNVLAFSAIQFLVCGALNLVLALILEPQGAANLLAGWQVIAYSALVPIGLGFTLQAAGQRHAPAVDAAIILSTEAVFGTLFAYLFLNELLSLRQILGCVLILVAMILAQIRTAEPMTPEAQAHLEPLKEESAV